MSDATSLTPSSPHQSPFEAIRRMNAAGNEFWSSRDFARVLGYSDYRNFEQVVQKARMACFNSAHRIEDHFVDVTEMIAERQVQNARPTASDAVGSSISGVSTFANGNV